MNHTLARTGIRLGEGLGLKWNDIDFDGRFIDIRILDDAEDAATIRNQ